MPRYTITPWRHQTDLLAVRSQLYRVDDTSEDLRRHAVDRVMAWKLRGNLPHAVESTALLVDAILHHTASQLNSSFSVRAVYAAAFTRFVTGFCDIGRAREGTLNPSSMLEIARQIDMPAQFVGLRHEATHEELPALGRLVQAANEGLDWLWQAYWSRLEEGPRAQQKTTTTMTENVADVKDQARALLRSYRSTRRDAFKKKRQGTSEHAAELHALAVRCEQLCDSSLQSVHAFVEVLIDERLLLPSSRDLGSSMQPAFMLWSDLLVYLSNSTNHFLTAMVNRLLGVLGGTPSSVDGSQDAEKEGVFLWLLELVRSEKLDGQDLQGMVVRQCCLHPSYWTERLGNGILKDAGEDLAEEWQDILEASALRNAGDSTEASAGGQGQADVQDAMDVADLPARHDDFATEQDGWQRMVVPPSVPIGVVA